MPLILRMISKGKWLPEPNLPWLKEDELQADVFHELKTGENTLSVWSIADDRSNLERVVAALAANRNRVSNFDYALISQERLQQAGLWSTPSFSE